MIPAAAVELAAEAMWDIDRELHAREYQDCRDGTKRHLRREAIAALEAAMSYMLTHANHHDVEKLATAWDAGHAAGMRREFEVIAHMKAGEPTPEAAPNPYRLTK